jgi:hypothetical protein
MINRPLILSEDDRTATMDGYERHWAREFRYEGDRQRYLARGLNPEWLYHTTQPDETRTEYAGDTLKVGAIRHGSEITLGETYEGFAAFAHYPDALFATIVGLLAISCE